jgi:hypothetical protein
VLPAMPGTGEIKIYKPGQIQRFSSSGMLIILPPFPFPSIKVSEDVIYGVRTLEPCYAEITAIAMICSECNVLLLFPGPL